MVNWFVGGLALAGVAVAVRCGIDLHRRHPAAPSQGGGDATDG
jgi:hypothetical protein